MNKKNKRNIFIFCMLFLPVLHFLIFFVYMNANTILMSFQRMDFMTGEVKFVALENYAKIFSEIKRDPALRNGIINSLLFIPVTDGILLPLSIVCAYVLSKRIFLHNAFRVIFFLPSIISIVIMTLAFSFMFDSTFGVVNQVLDFVGLSQFKHTWFGEPSTAMGMIFLYCIWAGIGFNVVLINGAITRIPQEIIEYGYLEGIKFTKELTSVIVPMIWPTISTLLIVGSTSAFTIFLQPMLLTNGGPNGSSYTINFYVVQQTQAVNYEWAATVGLFFSVLGLIMIMGFKYIVDKLSPNVEF